MKFKSLFFVILSVILINYSLIEAQGQNARVLNPKKGMGLSVNSSSGNCYWLNKILKLNLSWYYRWGYEYPTGLPDSIEWPPMIFSYHGNKTSLDSQINYLKNYVTSGRVHNLLGFNEPDNPTQANMTVSEAVEAWPSLMSLNVPLGSPACVDATDSWMKSFMDSVSAHNYRVDFVCVHWYSGANVSNFLNYIKEVHNLYHKPLWITEFAVADNSAKTVDNNRYSPEAVLQFMKAVLPVLDTLSYVQRYAWHGPPTATPKHWTAMLFDTTCTITPLGEYYAQYQYGTLAPTPDSPGVSLYSGIPPENGVSLNPTFKWNVSANANDYHIQVAVDKINTNDGSFLPQNVVFDTTVADTFVEVSNVLKGNTLYYWHVSSLNNSGESNYSTSYFFKTEAGLSSVHRVNQTPLNFELYQNYPNPFNPTTEINYSLAKSGYVLLKVYDVFGQEVSSLFKGFQRAGSYRVVFNASKLASGVYFYSLHAGDYVSIKKMVLLK